MIFLVFFSLACVIACVAVESAFALIDDFIKNRFNKGYHD